MVLSGCSKLTDNGPLDGKWQLCEIHSKSDLNAPHYDFSHVDYKNQSVYWNFQLNLLSITSKEMLNTFTTETTARFSYDKTTLHVGPTYIHYRDRDSLLTNPSTTELVPLGIHGNESNFNIKQLNHTTMILCSEYDSLVFYKLH